MASFERIRNPIFQLHWAGWESNSLSLQRKGWQISMMQSVEYTTLQVAIKHPQFRIYGVSRRFGDFNFMRNPSFISTKAPEYFPLVVIDRMATDMTVHIMADLSTFQPVSAVPEFVTEERKSIEDFKIFKPLDQVKEIIIAKPNVKELLDQIIAQQDPKQAEIRETRRKELRKIGRSFEGMSMENIEIIKPDEELVAQIVAVA